jgi:hypothetical protein
VLIAGRKVKITNPDKAFFPVAGYRKGDLLDYYLAVAEGAVRAVANRRMALKRFVQDADGEGLLPEASACESPGLDRDGGAQLSLAPNRRGDRRPRCCPVGLGGQSGLYRPQPAPRAQR